MAVDVDPSTSSLTVKDLGVTLRTLLAAAAEGQKVNARRDWQVRYKFVKIGAVRLRPVTAGEEEDARHSNSVEDSPQPRQESQSDAAD